VLSFFFCFFNHTHIFIIESTRRRVKSTRTAAHESYHAARRIDTPFFTIDYLEKGQAINSDFNMALFVHLNYKIKKQTAQIEEKKMCTILHGDS
jgi:hypothetical protein